MKKLLYFLLCALPFCGAAQTLQLEATSNKPDILTGETLTYTFKYTCSSTTSACTNVTLVAGAPSGILFPTQTIALTSDILSYTISPDLRTITFVFKEPLAAGSTGIVTVTGQGEYGLADGTAATLTAELKSGTTVGSSQTVGTTLHSTNKFCASKSNGVGLLPGGITTYQISMGYQSNGYSTSGIGVTSVTNISLVDQLPMGAVIESVTLDESFNAPGFVPAPAGTCVIDNANSRFTCTFPADYLKVQSNFTPIPKINVAVRYPEGLFTAPNPVTNSVVFKYTPLGGSEITLSNGDFRTYADGTTYPATGSLTCPATLSVTDNLASPILKLETKKWKPVNTLKVGQTSYFSLPVFNRGNTALDNVVVEDIIPSEITVITVNPAKFINVDASTVLYEAKTVNNPTYTPIVFTPDYWQIPEGDRLTHIRMTIPSMPPNSGTTEDYDGIRLNYRVNDDAVAPGSFQNCMTSTTTTAGVDLATANSCVTITLLPKDQFSNIAVDKRVVKTPMSPDNYFYTPAVSGDIAWMYIQAGNDLGGQPLSNPVVMDLLPLGLLYENEILYDTNTPTADVTDIIPNYNGTGRTLIRLKWNTPLASGGVLKFSIKTRISSQVPGGDPGTVANWNKQPYLDGPGLKNTAFFTGSSPSQCLIPQYESIGSVAAKDIYDLDGDGSTADTLCYFTGGAGVASSASMESVKWVKGECDTAYSKFPDFGSTMPGGLANYKLIVKNNGNVPTKAIEILDILPYIGDIGVKDTSPRSTAWRPNLVTPIATPTGVTVFYTTVQNPCRTDYVSGGPAGCNPPNWTTVLPSDPTTVQGLKFDFGTKVLNPGDEIELTWDMRAPVDAPTNNEIAWNSFGFKATRADNNDPFLPAEPNKVGIKLKPVIPAAYGDFVWIDTNKNGIQEAGEAGIDGVRVELHRDNGDGIADPKNDELVKFTATANGGKYLFPNLTPGSYFAVFFVPNGYSSSPANVSTPGDSLDSDGIATVCNGNRVTVTAITQIDANETDLRWDQGVFVDKAALGNYVWFDENSNNLQDESTTNGVNGVIVCLYKDLNNNGTPEPDAADGAPVARDTTSSDIYGRPGYYLFENLDPGKYFVKFKLATGQTFTPNSGTVNGSSDPNDSDPAPNGVTEVTDLTEGEVDLTWDAGIIIQTGPYNLGNFVWSDVNNNGKVDANEPGINGVSVILYEDRNNNNKPDPDEYVSSTTTTTVGGLAGTYTFTKLPAGNYIVQIPDANFTNQLKDFVSSTGNDPAPDPDDNVENDDNGTAVAGCGVISKPITLANNAEPLDGGITNYSVDFGFYKCTKPNYTMEVTQPTCAGGKGSILLGSGTVGDKVAFTAGDISTIPTYANATLISSLAGGVIVGNINNPTSDVTYIVRIYNGEDGCFKDVTFTIKPLVCCTKPVAKVAPTAQTICAGSTASAYTATPTTGVEYQWFGPLADTTGSLGTAISGQIAASYTPTGAALTAAGTKYYAVIVNTTGDLTCADTAFVQLTVNAKPNIIDGAATICAGETVDLTSKITDYATLQNPVWTVATAGGTAVTTPAAVKPAVTATYVLVAQNAAGCKDTANVVVTVNPKPDAGPDQTLACANTQNNTLTTATTLAPVTPGGTFTQIGTTPAVATITGNNVTGMTVAGTYQFQYKVSDCLDTVAVTVQPCQGCVKPDAGPDAATVCQPATTAKLTAVTVGGTWAPISSPANPAAAAIDANGNITGISAAGTYIFVYSVTAGGQTCTDTAQVVVNPKPNAGADQSICSPATTTTLTGTPSGGIWTAMVGNPVQASVSNAGVVTNMSVSGTYKFIYTLNGCTDTVAVVRKAAITAVNLGPGTICQNESLTYTDADGTDGTWSGPGVTDSGTGATLSAKAALAQLNKTAPVTFYIYYSQTVNGCSRTDSGMVTINPRPAVSIAGPTTVCSNGLPIAFTATPAGGTFSLPGGLPAGAVTISNNVATLNAGFNIASLTFSYKYTDAITGCDSTASHSITVTPKPNAGTDQTLACANAANNTLTTATVLVPSPAGGTWTQMGTAPTVATILGNNVSGMTVAGTYRFVYTLNGCSDTVAVMVQPCSGCVKPDAGPDAPNVCQPTATAKLTAVTAGGTWAPIGNPANPAAAVIDANGNISGLSAAGTYKFVYSVTGGGQTCTDTAQVTVNAKPSIADGAATICAGGSVNLTSEITNYATLLNPVWTLSTAGGTVVTTPTAVQPTATATYILVAQNAAGCKDTAGVVVTVNPKPILATANGFPACRLNGTAYTIKFTATGGTVTTVPSLTVTGDSIANIPLTTASVKLIITGAGGCKDSITVAAPTCDKPVGSIGDLIWKDVNDNGLQELPTEKGVAGVKVNLYAASAGTKTGSVLQTKTTGTDGLYLFTGLLAGDYIVEIDKTTLPDTCQITAKQNVPSDDTKDSDFNPATGLSQVITLNPVFNPTTPAQILATNNLTVDAGLVVPCVKSKVTVTAAPVCSANLPTYTLTFSVSNKVGALKVDKGVLSGSNPYTVTGIPSGATVKITDSLSAVCKFDTLITGPNCNCNPPLPVLVTPSLTACIGDTFPTIKATVVGQATVEWFTAASGGVPIFTGLNYKPSGVVTGDTLFYAQARSTDPACPAAVSTGRVAAAINAQNCTVQIDLALRKSINTKVAQIGDELTYTVKVFNQLNTAATGVEVMDSIATTVQFVTGSFAASRGNATITGNVIKWIIGGIAANPGANGDTVTLVYKVKAIQEGIHLNTAEISKTNEKDVDSTPGNGKAGEDDIETQCFTVPIKLCPSEKVQASVPGNLTNVQWFKNGSTTSIASGNTVLLSEVGTYTFTATNQTCPANGCCPVIIEPGTNCCPADFCVPFTVKKTKKK